MQTASLSPDHFNDVLGRLPPRLDLNQLAFESKAIERCREVGDGASLLRLALARGPGGMSLSQTAAWAGMIGLAEISAPGLKYRIDKAAAFLEGVVSHLLAEAQQGAPLHWPGRYLRAADGTGIGQHATKGLDWRVHGVFDLGLGRFSHLEVTDCHGAESLARGAAIKGEIRIGDRNYARAVTLRDLIANRDSNIDFIVRMSWRTFALSTLDGEPFSLTDHLEKLPEDSKPHELFVQASTARGEPPMKLRLIVVRKSDEAAAAARAKLPRLAQRKQKKLDPRTVVAAGFVILATSLPAKGFCADDICTAYRLRWHIELAFKRLKSLLHIDQLPTRTPPASRSWLLAHLILALLCDDISQEVLESFP